MVNFNEFDFIVLINEFDLLFEEDLFNLVKYLEEEKKIFLIL